MSPKFNEETLAEKEAELRGYFEAEAARKDTRFRRSLKLADSGVNDIGDLTTLEIQVPWPEMNQLPPLLPEAISMDTETAKKMIPEPILSCAIDVSERLQVAIESVATAFFSTLGSVIGRKVGIYPKANDDWLVLCILWCLIVGRPGEKKSAVMNEAQRGLDLLEDDARQAYESGKAKFKSDHDCLKARIDAQKDLIKAAAKEGNNASLETAQKELERLNETAEGLRHIQKRYKTNDGTIEKIADILKGNPNGIQVTRDELSALIESFNRAGHETARQLYLESWNGKGRYTIDRVGSGTTTIEALCLTVFGATQPGRLENLVREAASGGTGADGFIQRLQLLTWPERRKTTAYIDRAPDKAARKAIDDLFKKVDTLTPVDFGVEPTQAGALSGVRFTVEGQKVSDDYAKGLDKRLCEEEFHPTFESHLAKYRSLMPALALLFHVTEWAASNGEGDWSKVSKANALRAVAWCEFLESHAAKAYAVINDSENHGAHALAKKIKEGRVKDGEKVRDVYRHHWEKLGNSAEVDAALAVLKDAGWVRTELTHADRGAPSEIIKLHPTLLRGASK